MRAWVHVVVICGCGAVSAPKSDAPGGGDGPKSNLANGTSCSAATECTSGNCECKDAACASKVCSATTCACQYTSSGTSCDGDVAAGTKDGTSSCGTGTCDGTGVCGTPLLWFKFDEPAGASTVANSGSWPGQVSAFAGTLGVPGQVGTALQLSAMTDGVGIDDPGDGSLDGFTAWTAEAWLKFSTLPVDGYATIVKKNNAYICRVVEAAGCPSCYYDQSIVFSPGQLTTSPQLSTAPTTPGITSRACTPPARWRCTGTARS